MAEAADTVSASIAARVIVIRVRRMMSPRLIRRGTPVGIPTYLTVIAVHARVGRQ
jgi:hypothetical protein